MPTGPRRPNSVLVGSVLFRIEWVDSSKMDRPRDMTAAPQRWGDCRNDLALIRIATDVPISVQRLTLFHEIGHAICGIFGHHRHQSLRDYTMLKRKSPWRIEELYVTIFEHTLEVIKDNPKVMEWIQTEDGA